MDLSEKKKSDWSNYWLGRTASQTGEVFGLVEVENSEELSTFWAEQLHSEANKVILDLACGAGSVLKNAPHDANLSLIGVDISAEAVKIAEQHVTGLRGVVSSADQVPLDSDSVDLVVSQFGFEYAGTGVGAEVARILKPGGRFVAIAHQSGSAIERECQQHLATLSAIEGSAFIVKAKALFRDIMRFERTDNQIGRDALNPVIEQFQAAQATLIKLAKLSQLATHLYDGTKQLFERRSAYDYKDIENWLDGMSVQVEAYHGRMKSMIEAALTEQQAREFLQSISSSEQIEISDFMIENDSIGYVLKATS